MKKFDLNIETVLENWEVHHGVREIIANAIDEQIITQAKEMQIFKDSIGSWHIRDFGRGLKYEHLTLKENEEKINNLHLIGKFGVGLKDALATFDRRGVKVFIKSRFGEITLGKSEKHDFEDIITLHAYLSPSTDVNFEGTEFILSGCSDKDIERAKNLFLKFSGENVLEKTDFGEVLEKKEKVARIYINGVYAAEENNFLFSYNITSLTAAIRKALNRERVNVGRTAYSDRIKGILMECQSKAIAERLTNDLKEFQTGNLHDELKWSDVSAHATKLLNSLEKVVFITPEQIIQAPDMVEKVREDGYKIVTIPDNVKDKVSGQEDFLGKPIQDLNQFQKDYRDSFKFKFVDSRDLNSKEAAIFAKTSEILDFIGGKPSIIKEIKISETMRPESFRITEVTGTWEQSSGTIIIKRTQLENLELYAGTLLHEVAHAISGATDASSEFEKSLTKLLGKIVSLLDSSQQKKTLFSKLLGS